MRGKKTSDNIKAKVIEVKINAPYKSSRDIANELGGSVSNDTVCDILNDDLPQVATESTRIADLVTRNNNLQSLADVLIQKMIESEDESITIAQLTSLRESTFKQNQLIGGKATDIHKIEGISREQAELISKLYIIPQEGKRNAGV